MKPKFPRRQDGLEAVLGPLEAAIMEALWRSGGGEVADVNAALPRESAYTTVKTVMERLTDKGFLERQKVGRAYTYRPVLSKGELEAQTARHLSQGLLRGFGSAALTHFVGAVQDDPAQLQALRELLSQIEGEAE